MTESAKWIGGLINNAAVLLALGIFLDLLLSKDFVKNKVYRQIFTGIAVGGVALAVMINPVQFSEGIFFDTRSIIMGISGLFFGVIPTVIGAVMAAAFRIFKGGSGAAVGVIITFVTALTGLIWAKVRRRAEGDISIGEMYIFGLVIHIEMMLFLLALPGTSRNEVFLQMIIPILSIYPVATALFGRLMSIRLIRRSMLEQLTRSETRLRNLFENAPVGIFRTNVTGQVIEVNGEMARILGCSTPEEALRVYTDLAAQLYVDPQRRQDFIQRLRKNGKVMDFPYEGRKIDGSSVWISMNARLTTDEYDGAPVIDGFSWDITEKKKAREDLENALAERETLLRELYHRTKNNMQVIASMLSLKRSAVESGEVKEVLKELEGKIYSMALVHQKLYKSGSLSRLDLKEYITELGGLIEDAYGRRPGPVSITYDLCPLSVLIDTAVPLGLVINELIVNSFKHAFPGDRRGTIAVSMEKINQTEYSLVISDDGIGLNGKNLSVVENRSLGLRTVKNLVQGQLGGQVEFISNLGFTGKIIFAPELYHERV
ncbi:MAG: sensor histidine kinase [Spirochaetia bacterium]